MAAKRRGQQPRARATAVAVPRARRAVASTRRLPFMASRRSVGIGLATLAVAGGLYAAARESSAFAVRTVEVSGASAGLQAQVRTALAPLMGTNLLVLDGASVERRIEAIPAVLTAHYDRSFPHTLHVTVVPEKPVAVLRRGTGSWLVSARGRVIARVPRGGVPALPRIWIPTAVDVVAGGFLDGTHGGIAARSLALVSERYPARIAAASFVGGDLTYRLRSGLELRLGDPTDVRLKLAIARRALFDLPPGAAYLDVSVPRRPVSGTDPRVSSRG